MRFYKELHQFYTGIDLHARTMYVCVMNNSGSVVYHKNMGSSGMFPMAYVYPKEMRATRDLLRRREYFVRHQAELYTHIENTNSQYNFDSSLETRRMKSASSRR